MDRDYARAYMTERLEAAEHRRRIAAINSDIRPQRLTRLAKWFNSVVPRPTVRVMAVTPLESLEPDCCPA